MGNGHTARTAMASLEQVQLDGVTLLQLFGTLTQEDVGRIAPAFHAATGGPGAACDDAPHTGASGAPDAHGTGSAARSPRVVVDLTGVKLIATTGIALLLVADRRLRQLGGKLVVTGTAGLVQDALHRCRLDEVFSVAPTREQAIRRAKEA